MDRIQSAAYQKDRARRLAYSLWERDYYWDRCRNQFLHNVTGSQLEGHAYTHAITSPPSEHNHPLWKAATDVERDDFGRKTKRPLYSRHTTSTALQLAVDHAFTGSYAQRFRPLDPPETLGCPCGAPLRTPGHVIRECPLFYQTRVNRAITLIPAHSHSAPSFLM